ncbi:hypothetical protein SAMN05216302_10217 [Nitrosomonas aestuarii]|uniref:DUF4376 domain-containing protein n=2 Tax=Nitrosomonas aestuarii TaxID=52441 RepID=A0A1I4DHD6_9PROT|nr:hypothetical protein SAMN05216302_10217 [Nitrosomonas aestuarii]
MLVNKPNGEQTIIPVLDGGKYNDSANVLWDELADGPMPVGIVLGKMARQGSSLVELQDYIPAHLNAVLPVTKAAKIESLITCYEAEIYAYIVHTEKTWAADKKTQEILAQVLAVGSVPLDMYWRDITGTSNPMTYADLQSLASAILARGLVADTKLAEKITAVNAATTLTQVDSVTW